MRSSIMIYEIAFVFPVFIKRPECNCINSIHRVMKRPARDRAHFSGKGLNIHPVVRRLDAGVFGCQHDRAMQKCIWSFFTGSKECIHTSCGSVMVRLSPSCHSEETVNQPFLSTRAGMTTPLHFISIVPASHCGIRRCIEKPQEKKGKVLKQCCLSAERRYPAVLQF